MATVREATTTTTRRSISLDEHEIRDLIVAEAEKKFGRDGDIEVEFDCYGGGFLLGATVSTVKTTEQVIEDEQET